MFTIFSDAIRTKKQKARYFWAKRVIAVLCGAAAYQFAVDSFGSAAIALGLITFFLSYVTIAPIAAAAICFLEEMAGL